MSALLKAIHPSASIHPDANVDEEAVIGANVVAAPYAVIRGTVHADVTIGEAAVIHKDAVIGPHAAIGRYAIVGPGVTIPAGAVIPPSAIVQDELGVFNPSDDDLSDDDYANAFDACRSALFALVRSEPDEATKAAATALNKRAENWRLTTPSEFDSLLCEVVAFVTAESSPRGIAAPDLGRCAPFVTDDEAAQ